MGSSWNGTERTRAAVRLWRWVRRLFVTGLSAVTTLTVTVLLMDLWITWQARDSITNDYSQLAPVEYGMLLGTSKFYSGGINPFYEARIQAAAKLYHAGIVETLIASGDHSTPFYNEPGMMFDDLVALGVPEAAIVQDGGGVRTLSSVRRLRSEFDQSDVIIISQRFHVERALYQAAAAGLRAQGFAAEDAPVNWHIRVRLREVLARVSAMIDIHILRRTDEQALHY